MRNYSQKMQDIIEDWVNEPNSSKQIIDCLVEQLTCDNEWVKQHISQSARKNLVALVDYLNMGADK